MQAFRDFPPRAAWGLFFLCTLSGNGLAPWASSELSTSPRAMQAVWTWAMSVCFSVVVDGEKATKSVRGFNIGNLDERTKVLAPSSSHSTQLSSMYDS